jgi:hypothetical protein
VTRGHATCRAIFLIREIEPRLTVQGIPQKDFTGFHRVYPPDFASANDHE